MKANLPLPKNGSDLEQLTQFVGLQMKHLNDVLSNIDGANIVDIKFNLNGGAYLRFNRKGITFFDGTKVTFKVDVNGKPTMTGATVQAVEGEYPNVVFDGGGNIFTAAKSEDEFIAINPSYTGSPALLFESPNSAAFISAIDSISQLAFNVTRGNMSLNVQSGKMQLSALTDIELLPTGQIKVTSWSKLYNGSQTLQQALDAKQDEITSGDVTVISGVATLGNNINTTHLANGSVSNTEFQYLDGVTSAIQTQLNSKLIGSGRLQAGSGTATVAVAGTPVNATMITFPVAFSNTPKIKLQVTAVGATTATYINLMPSSLSNTALTVQVNSGVAQVVNFDWIAVGPA